MTEDANELERALSSATVDLRQAGRTFALVGGLELLAMKVLSMTDQRLQDRLDARHLLQYNPDLDLEVTRTNLALITSRGFARDQDLQHELTTLMQAG